MNKKQRDTAHSLKEKLYNIFNKQFKKWPKRLEPSSLLRFCKGKNTHISFFTIRNNNIFSKVIHQNLSLIQAPVPLIVLLDARNILQQLNLLIFAQGDTFIAKFFKICKYLFTNKHV